MAIIPACKVSSSSSINSSNLSLDHIDSLSPFFCSVYSGLFIHQLGCFLWCACVQGRQNDRPAGILLFWPELLLSFSVNKNSCCFNCYPWMWRCESKLSKCVVHPRTSHCRNCVLFPFALLFHPYCPVNWRACWCSTRLTAPEVIAGTSKPLYLLKFCFFWHTAISQNQFPTFLNMLASLLKTNQTSHSILWK